ncbi:D-2-hydroxyacid dehydrogenase [Paraburkholderia metrosideri]|uniref:D-2-hydroxyacid dehydrogenase n=1 Tax=Paraburkholderia metrosideri TaxID=580937 RepID=A0ABW9E5F4_9BURK
MNVVILDANTLPVPVLRPSWASAWAARSTTRADDVVDALSDAAIAITNKVPIRREDLEHLPRLRFICVAATGYDCVDIEACRERGIVVSNVPGYSAQSVSEWVIASIFALRRSLPAYQVLAREAWARSPSFCVHGAPIRDIAGATLGIFGRGAIGQATGRLAGALGMNVLYAERRDRVSTRDGFVPFYDVLRAADVLSLHCPLTEQTRNLIGRKELETLKPGALLVNSARGALIDSYALIDALASGKLAGAALDVLPAEPPDSDDPVLNSSHPNLIVTPHISWAATSGSIRLNEGISANLNAFHAGKPVNLVPLVSQV